MDHFDTVLPGRVLRVFHEAVIEDTEAQVRRLLDYVGVVSIRRACASTKTGARSVPPVPNRSAARSIATGWTNGSVSTAGSIRFARLWALF
jgi:hypothetical protein